MLEINHLTCNYCKKTSYELDINSRWMAISNLHIDIFLCELCIPNHIEIEKLLIKEINEGKKATGL